MHDLVFYVVVVPRFWLDCTHLGVSTRTCKVYCNCKERNAVFMVQINVFMKKEGEKNRHVCSHVCSCKYRRSKNTGATVDAVLMTE